MRRPLAILLAIFFAFGPLYGLVEASDDTRLPACCRRHGAHHCAMSAEMLSALQQITGSAPAFTAPSTCPLFPGCALGILTPPHALASHHIEFPVLLRLASLAIKVDTIVHATPLQICAGRAPPSSDLPTEN